MIAPDFYVPKNRITVSGVVLYKPRPKAVVLNSVQYVVMANETIYSIALKLFGDDAQYYWTIIEDINNPLLSKGLNVGDTLFLPTVIVKTI